MGQANVKKSIDISSISVPKIKSHRIQLMYSALDKEFVVGKGTYGFIFIGLLDGKKLVAIKKPRLDRQTFKKILNREAKIGTLLYQLGACVPKIYGETMDGSIVYELFLFSQDLVDKETMPKQGKVLFSSHKKIMRALSSGTPSDVCNLLASKLITAQMKQSHWLGIMIDVTQAVQMIHSLGFTHTDIKADNVLIHFDDSFPFRRPKARLADFGYVFKENQTGFVSNKPWYPPEQASPNARNSKALDIYSLGKLFEEISQVETSLKTENIDLQLLIWSMTQAPAARTDIEKVLKKLILVLKRVERQERKWATRF